MAPTKALEQHIAVFGAGGSGKTVLLSSFYGAAQDPQNIKRDGFHVTAENPAQGIQLDQNYLGMKKEGKLPPATRFAGKSYSFLVNLKTAPPAASARSNAFDALRLVWHDYPGEWFEQDVSGSEESQRRLQTFHNLLSSDVAILAVDGQRLVDNAGQEERYLKSMLNTFRSMLLLLKGDLLPDGKPLVKFPRIWVMALTKSDLLPDMTVDDFKDLLVQKVGSDMNELRDVIAGFLQGSSALAVGEDFVLLSSAKFDPEKINVGERVGLDLILPLAAVLPFQRHLKWAERMTLPRKVALELLSNVEAIAIALGALGAFIARLIGTRNRFLGAIAAALSAFAPELVKWANGMITNADRAALAKQSTMAATLLEFQEHLDKGQEQKVLRLSPR